MDTALKGIAYVTLRMNDYEQTVAFYTRLGLTKTFEMETKSDILFGFSNEGNTENSGGVAYTEILCSSSVDAPPPGETGIRIKLSEKVDLGEWVKQMQAQEVKFMTSEVNETDWVYEIKIADPAGNILTIFK